MNSKIIICSNPEKLAEYFANFIADQGLKTNHPDLLQFEVGEKMGIEQVKKIGEFLSIKPFSAKGKVVIIPEGQNLSLDAQNALLKTLEEPPITSYILLGVQKEEDLLPTVLSRCELVILEDASPIGSKMLSLRSSMTEDIKKLEKTSLEERFKYIEKLEEKEELLEALLAYYREKLGKDPKALEYSKLLIKASEWEQSNVNTRAILEYLMLKMP